MTVSIVSNTQSVTEGRSISFTLFPVENKLHVWQIYNKFSAKAVSANDFAGNRLKGTVYGRNGRISLVLTVLNDQIVEADEEFELVIYHPTVTLDKILNEFQVAHDAIAFSQVIKISDLVQSASAVSPSSAIEGNVVSVTVNTQNVTNGSLLAWRIMSSNMNLADFSLSSLTGTAAVRTTTAGGSATVSIPIKTDFVTEGNESFYVQFFRPGVTWAQINAGGHQPWVTTGQITVSDLIQSATCSVTKTSVVEGDPVSVQLQTTNIAKGTVIYWKIIGNNIDAKEFISTPLTGLVSINNGAASVGCSPAKDFVTEGTETFKFVFYKPGSTPQAVSNGSADIFAESPSISIVDAIQTIEIQPLSSTSLTEGQRLAFGVKTQHVPDGARLVWRTVSQNMTADDFADKKINGTLTISKGTASLTRDVSVDILEESGDKFKILIYRPGVTLQQAEAGAPAWAEWPEVSVSDIVQTASVTLSTASSIAEGQNILFKVNTTNVANGTRLAYKIHGNHISADDFQDGKDTGLGTVVSGKFSVLKILKIDRIEEPGQSIKMSIYKQGVDLQSVVNSSATPWVTSAEILVTDK